MDFLALTLVGPIQHKPVLDPLDVHLLENRLYIPAWKIGNLQLQPSTSRQLRLPWKRDPTQKEKWSFFVQLLDFFVQLLIWLFRSYASRISIPFSKVILTKFNFKLETFLFFSNTLTSIMNCSWCRQLNKTC